MMNFADFPLTEIIYTPLFHDDVDTYTSVSVALPFHISCPETEYIDILIY